MLDHRSRTWRVLYAWPLILVVIAVITLFVTASAEHGRNPWARLFLVIALSVFYYLCAIRVVEAQGKTGKWDRCLPSIHLLVKGVDRGALWTVLFFVPVVHIFMFMLISFKLADAAGKSRVWGYLQLIPFVHVFALYLVVAAIQDKARAPAGDGDGGSASNGQSAAGEACDPQRP